MKRSEIAKEARKLVGLNWVHQGRIPEIGIDCLGIVVLTAKAFNYGEGYDRFDYKPIPEFTNDSTSSILIEGLRAAFVEIPIGDALEGDILTFTMPDTGDLPRHVGIVVKGRRELNIVHALMQKKTLEEPLAKWKNHITHAFRFKNLED